MEAPMIHRRRSMGVAMAAARRRTRGCLLYVAAAGYGKTTALEAIPGDGATAWYSGAELLTWLARPTAGGLHRPPGRPPAGHVVIDDLPTLPAAALPRLARALDDVPDQVRVSLAGRRPPSDAALAALPAPVLERTAPDLALRPVLVAAVLREEHGVDDADLAFYVHEVTAGWPALVQHAGAAIRRTGADRTTLLAALTDPATAGAGWLRDEALAGLPRAAARLLESLAGLDPVTAALCAALDGRTGAPRRAADRVRWLTRSGLLVAHPRHAGARGDPALRVVPAVAAVLCAGRPTARGRAVRRRAAGWYAGNGYPLAAARAFADCGDRSEAVAVIEARGDEILAAGGATEVVPLIDAVPVADRSRRLRLVLGDALRMSGDVAGALSVFEPMLAAARPTGACDAGLAWRAAMAHYLRSDYPAARRLCELAPADPPGTTADTVLLAVCRSSVRAMLGDSTGAAAQAALAVRLASVVGGDRVLAAAHVAAALTAVGARRDEHLADALAAAERAGDLVQAARVLVNQAGGLLRQARYAAAADAAARAVRAAEAGGPPGILAVALCNAGEALLRLGRYDEAGVHFERTVQLSRRLGLRRSAMGLWGLAELDRLLGRREQSRTGFAEAAELARATGDVQVLLPALAGLARVLVDGPRADHPAARAAADEAERIATPLLASRAMVAAGWVALAGGSLVTAQQRAAAAVRAARETRRADCLAEALELAATVSTDTGAADPALREAEAIWRRAGAVPAADRLVVQLGTLPGAGGADRAAARAATQRLQALGVRMPAGACGPPAEAAGAAVRIQVLGRFEVLVGGRAVPLTAWRSRQARSLVKILVAHRGRPVARAELTELLWPDDDPQRTGHRLSVLQSTVRGVLDPTRLWPADHHVRADVAGISLDTDHVSIDAEELLRDADHAVQLRRDGAPERARELLVEVAAGYRGGAFGDEPYEQWSDGLREEVRAVWLRSLRCLAELSAAAGDVDQAVTSLVRLLAADPFDESAHRGLVRLLQRAGRHGEAHRAFGRWAHAMASIDAPAPDRGLLNRQASAPPSPAARS